MLLSLVSEFRRWRTKSKANLDLLFTAFRKWLDGGWGPPGWPQHVAVPTLGHFQLLWPVNSTWHSWRCQQLLGQWQAEQKYQEELISRSWRQFAGEGASSVACALRVNRAQTDPHVLLEWMKDCVFFPLYNGLNGPNSQRNDSCIKLRLWTVKTN